MSLDALLANLIAADRRDLAPVIIRIVGPALRPAAPGAALVDALVVRTLVRALVEHRGGLQLLDLILTTLLPALPRTDSHPPAPATPAAGGALTARETQVLTGMADGRTNGEIGRELYLTEDTVKSHARRLYHKLGARDRAHAVRIAYDLGIFVAGPQAVAS